METTTQSEIKKSITKSALSLDKLTPAQFKKDMLTAQIRQVVTTVSTYPSQRVSSDMQNSLYAPAEFNIEGKPYTSEENRVAFILIPVGATEKEVIAKLEAATKDGACIYKVLSNRPILDSNQLGGIEAELTTVDIIANAQAVRFPVGHEKEGQLITDAKNQPQYRRTFFWGSAKEDMDLRGKEEAYYTPEIKAELMGASVMQGQTL